MSTILKALRRLEQDKAFDSPESLREHVVATPVEQAELSLPLKFLVVLGGAAASAAVGGLAFAIYFATTSGDPPAVASAPTALESSTAPEVASARPLAPRTSLQSDVVREVGSWRSAGEPAAELASARRGTSATHGSDVSGSSIPAIATVRTSASRPTTRERFDELASGRDESASPTPTPAAEIAPREPAIVVVASRVLEEAAQREAQIEFANDVALVMRERVPALQSDDRLSLVVATEEESPLEAMIEEPLPVVHRARVPSLTVVQTVWHPQPARREVVLRVDQQDQLVRLAEGDAIGPLVVLEIQPASVVFDHGGVQIQKRVGGR